MVDINPDKLKVTVIGFSNATNGLGMDVAVHHKGLRTLHISSRLLFDWVPVVNAATECDKEHNEMIKVLAKAEFLRRYPNG